MSASWLKIKSYRNLGNLEVSAVRTNTNSLGTFRSKILIIVDEDLEDTVEGYSASELETFVEANCDVASIDASLNPTELPVIEDPEDNLPPPPENEDPE